MSNPVHRTAVARMNDLQQQAESHRATHQKPPQPSGRRLLVALAAWVGASITVGLATNYIGGILAPEWAADPHNVAAFIVAEVYALLVASLLVTYRGWRRSADLALRPPGPGAVMLGLVVWVGAYALAFLGYATVEAFASLEPSISEVLAGVGSDAGRLGEAGIWGTALILGRIWILSPLGEELLFRGALFGWIRRHFPAWPTIGLTAALWALVHQIPIMMPLAFIVGVGAGWVRERTGSVWPVIAAHAVQSLIIVTAARFFVDWSAPLPI